MEAAMLKMQRILCPVDFSEFSDRAYEYALSFARHFGAKLFVQHVIEPVVVLPRMYISPPLIDQIYAEQDAGAEEKIHELTAKHSRNGVECEVVLQRGPVADSVLQFAEDQNIDLIAMGTHGRRGLDRIVLGSVTERVLRTAHCPVLGVHNPAQVTPETREEPIEIRKILFCTDFSDNSPRALEYAFLLACQYKAEISLLHVLERSGSNKNLEAEKRETLERLHSLAPDDVKRCVTVVPAVRAGQPYQEILEDATENQTDLIVLGVRGRNVINLALFGSTTYRVIQLGSCPVLVVRT
jgi:nucleotide-binding universal stress UspA family protein